MIGDDDWDVFFDPDELGVLVRFHVPGEVVPRETGGMWGEPRGDVKLRRGGSGGTGLSVKPGERPLQIAARELPDDWRETRVVVAGVDYAISSADALGRLRVLLTLTPWKERVTGHGKWLRN